MTTIGLDLAYLAPGATGGMETYARALVPALGAARPELRWVAFAGRELAAELRRAPWLDGMRVVELPVSSETRFRRVAVEQFYEPLAIRRARVDLLHSLGNTAPLAPWGPPLVLTVMDLIWKRHPQTATRLMGAGLAALVPRAVRRAARVIAPSQATADDLTQLLGADPAKLRVVALGPGGEPVDEPTPEAELRARLDLGDGPLVLTPAAQRAHKNLRRLVEAMAGLDATLVVVGYASIEEPGLRAAAARARVRTCGWLEPADLEALYRAATLLAFPSRAEGFGLPVLEAMRRGLPVACSNATSLPEVAGDAALLFDPDDSAAIRDAVVRLLDDASLRAQLIDRGREQAARFSWEATARGTLAVYDEVLAR